MSIATKLGKMVTYDERLLPIKSHDLLITWSCEITWQTKNISTTAMSLTTKIGRLVTYLEGPLPIESHDHLI